MSHTHFTVEATRARRELMVKLFETGLWGKTYTDVVDRVFDLGLIEARQSLPYEPVEEVDPDHDEEWKKLHNKL